MELDFNVIAPRLRTIGLHITQEEQGVLNVASPWLLHEFNLEHIQYFGKVLNVTARPYIILRGFREGADYPIFLVSRDGVKWEELPFVDEKVIAALEVVDFGLTSQKPFSGKLNVMLPRPSGEPEEEEGSEEETPEEGEEEDSNPKEPQPKKDKPLKPTEAHRLAYNINEIHKHMQLIIPSAYTKSAGAPVRNVAFRGLTNPSSKDIAVKDIYVRFLANDYAGDVTTCKTIADYPSSFVYPCRFDVLSNSLNVSSRFWPGSQYYVFAGTLIWGSVYEGNGLMNVNVMHEK